MRVAVGEVDGTIVEMKKVDTPVSFERGLALLIQTMTELREGREVTGAVVGIAGILYPDRRSLIYSPHLTGWEKQDFSVALEAALGIPVMLENDAAIGALGEAIQGAGAGSPIVAYVAVGTGIGGARIVDGRIDRNVFGFEIGHQYLSHGDGTEFEHLVSGSAVESSLHMPAKDVIDPAVWRAHSKTFSYGLYNTLLHWSPDCLVLGGSLMRNNGMRVEDIIEDLRSINRVIPMLPEVKIASLEYPGVIGALRLGSLITA